MKPPSIADINARNRAFWANGGRRVRDSGGWSESDHPRADNGQFGAGGGSSVQGKPSAEAREKVKGYLKEMSSSRTSRAEVEHAIRVTSALIEDWSKKPRGTWGTLVEKEEARLEGLKKILAKKS